MERRFSTATAPRHTRVLATLWFVMVASAVAVLFGATDADATTVDAGRYTTGTTMNLDWSDLTLTDNDTWNRMQAGAVTF